MVMTSKNTTIGFIGTGVMGASMAYHLLQAGYRLHVHTRTKQKADALLEQGATWHDTVTGVARAANLVVTIVGYPADVEQVYLGEDGLVANGVKGTYLIDMTTSSPALALRIHAAAKQRGMAALDAPVSGGDVGAREARLSIMVGGDREAFDRVRPVLDLMGRNVVYQGAAGSGQHTKMANQIAIAAGMVGVCESIAYARRAGLDPHTVLRSIGGGAAASWSLNNLGPRMVAGDFAPGFYVKHFLKDMAIAEQESCAMGLHTPGLSLAAQLYERLAAEGGESDGTQALYRLFDTQGKGEL